MKNLLICIVILCSFRTNAQDTLVFKDGDIIDVDLIAIDTIKGLALYAYKSDTTIVNLNNIKTYFINSEFSETLPATISKHAVESITEYTPRYGFFSNPVDYNRGRFAITTNLTSLLNKSNLDNLVFAENRVVTIEPEYFIFKWMSVKIPVGFGINQVKPQADPAYNSWIIYNENWENPSIPPAFSSYFFDSWDYAKVHPHNIIYQIGIYTKHFSKISKKNYIYFTQGISFGKCNLYAVDYFNQFNLSSADYDHWVIAGERIVIQNNTANYIRYELLGGLNWNLYKFINLTIETGYSTPMGSNVKKEDHVYRSLNNNAYELMGTDLYSNDNEKGRFIFRIGLSLRLGRKEVSAESK